MTLRKHRRFDYCLHVAALLVQSNSEIVTAHARQ